MSTSTSSVACPAPGHPFTGPADSSAISSVTSRPAPCRPPPTAPTPIRLSVRLEGARECTGHHTQPMLFRPLADETLCAACAAPTRDEPVPVPGGERLRAPS